jgi:hypothetical protein
MNIRIELLVGFVLGFELFFEQQAATLELGFIRVLFDWEN